jgi:hypothetical protein
MKICASGTGIRNPRKHKFENQTLWTSLGQVSPSLLLSAMTWRLAFHRLAPSLGLFCSLTWLWLRPASCLHFAANAQVLSVFLVSNSLGRHPDGPSHMSLAGLWICFPYWSMSSVWLGWGTKGSHDVEGITMQAKHMEHFNSRNTDTWEVS